MGEWPILIKVILTARWQNTILLMPWMLNFRDGGVVRTDRKARAVEGRRSDERQNLVYDVEFYEPICTSRTVHG